LTKQTTAFSEMKSSKGVERKPKKIGKKDSKRPSPPACLSSQRKTEWNEFLDQYFDDERFNITVDGDAVLFTFCGDNSVSMDFGDGMGVTVAYNDNFDYFESNTITEIVEQVTSNFMNQEMEDEPEFLDSDEDEAERDVVPEDDKDLRLEINNFKVMFGEEYIVLNPMYSMKNLEVLMKLPPLETLRMTTAQAWGVDPHTPLLIKLDIPYENYYQNSKPPKIEVFQMDDQKKKKVKLGVQIQNLLTSFANYHWSNVCYHSVRKLAPEDAAKYRDLKEDLPQKAKPAYHPALNEKDHKKLVKQLVDMGFKKSYAHNALTYVSTTEEAVEMITNNDKRILKPKPAEPDRHKGMSLSLKKGGKAPRVDTLFKDSQLALKCETDEEKWQVCAPLLSCFPQRP